MKSVVLLSGGMDSTYNLYRAFNEGSVLLALTFNYGQRAARKEIEKARELTHKMRIPHHILELPFFKEWGGSSLIDTHKTVPVADQVKIDDHVQSQKTAKSVWVPNRNGIFLNIAAGYAESLGADVVVPGFNREEAATFPDNSSDFVKASTQSLFFSTSNQVRVKCWSQDLNKTEIVQDGTKWGVDWSLIWPCYFMEDIWCGECESCLRSKRAFYAAGVDMNKFYRK